MLILPSKVSPSDSDHSPIRIWSTSLCKNSPLSTVIFFSLTYWTRSVLLNVRTQKLEWIIYLLIKFSSKSFISLIEGSSLLLESLRTLLDHRCYYYYYHYDYLLSLLFPPPLSPPLLLLVLLLLPHSLSLPLLYLERLGWFISFFTLYCICSRSVCSLSVNLFHQSYPSTRNHW